jgi:hypothetical protein
LISICFLHRRVSFSVSCTVASAFVSDTLSGGVRASRQIFERSDLALFPFFQSPYTRLVHGCTSSSFA